MPMSRVLEIAGEAVGAGKRLKRARFTQVVAKLHEHSIFMRVHTSKVINNAFNVPVTLHDESPGMESQVRVSYDPEGSHFKPSTMANEASPLTILPPPILAKDEMSEVTPVSQFTQVTQVTQDTPKALDGFLNESAIWKLRRLRQKLLKLSEFVRPILTELDESLMVIDSVLDDAPSTRASSSQPPSMKFADSDLPMSASEPPPDQTRRPLGKLSKMFDDLDEDDEEEEDVS